ncbi:MAG: hypothetical protein ACXV8K_02630 [Ilumatobacteraceae bacterium]
MASRQLRWVLLGVLLASACTSRQSSTAPTTSSPPAGLPGRTIQTVPVTAAPEPTGVPGLNASDPFCAAWAAYAGTLQALGVAGSFGNIDEAQFAALELASAPRLVDAAAQIDASWPPQLATEQATVVDQRIGPYVRRAQRGVEALKAAGVTAAELSALSSAWQQSLAERDPRVAVIELPAVPEALQAKVDAAGKAWNAAVTPFAKDPSLVSGGVATPETDQYLAAHCPDLASLGVGDAL